MDLVGPHAQGLAPDAGALVARIADQAAEVDAHGVRREVIDALAAQGLVGERLPSGIQRELGEQLAKADASTWFCWVQHQTPVAILEGEVPGVIAPAGAAFRAELVPHLRRGTRLAAVAFAHVRRPGPPDPIATRTSDGWRFDGHLDWVTSWDIADDVMIMARGDGAHPDVLVCAYLPAGASAMPWPGVEPGPVLDLLAMSGTHTRPVLLSAVDVPDDRIVVIDRAEWAAADAIKTSDANPAVFGITRGAVDELDEVARARGDAAMSELAEQLAERCRRIRSNVYEAADAGAPVRQRLELRAEALELAVLSAVSVITARAGAAMQRGCSAERRVREAMFLQVQAQTSASRSASIELLLSRLRTSSPAYDDALGR